MKIIQFTLKFTLYLGIGAYQSVQKHPFNRQNILALLILGSSTISCLIHFFRNAQTFADYTYSVAAFSSMLVATIVHAIILWKMPALFECLDELERCVDESELDYLSMYML